MKNFYRLLEPNLRGPNDLTDDLGRINADLVFSSPENL